MIRNVTPGRIVYRISSMDPRTLEHRPHVEAVTITGLTKPLLDGRRPVGAWVKRHPWDDEPNHCEFLAADLHATPEAAMSAYERRWAGTLGYVAAVAS